MLAHLGLYRRLVLAQVRSQLRYRASFVMDVLAVMVTSGAEFAAVGLVFASFDRVGGWRLGEVAFLYGLVELSFGLMDLVFGGFDPDFMGAAVRRGELDKLLLRPAPLALQVFGSEFQLRRLGKVLVGTLIFALAVSLAGIDWTPAKVLYLPLVVLGMIMFFGGLFVIGGTITFWTVESVQAMNVLTYGGLTLMSYPMTVYTASLRRLFTYVVPAAFLNYYPALYFLGRPDPFGLPGFAPFLAPLVGAFTLAAAFVFWRFGLRHYGSTGT
ncbi:ABC transporter permease [Deinococcus pimensis]|uniref:ABC transporter permease n=1 Tax=Deinococcus pimensis TaxID=309888 RepID=UPI0004BA7F6C|nr:ABC-2 family transporter protein [Deinococcus pimensis]